MSLLERQFCDGRRLAETLGGRFQALIAFLRLQANKKVVVLVDEYDAPLLNVMDDPKALEAFRMVMREFYIPLKACDADLRFVFLTGITKFSQLSIFSELNNLTNISMDPVYAGICGITEDELLGRMSEDVSALAERLGVADVLDKFPHEMSGGQKQRVAAARAIVTDPSLVLADEPTGALDSRNSRLLLESLEDLNDAGATIIMVTHDSFAASYARRALFLKDGRVWNELVRGSKTRKQFFNEIMDVVSFLGGEGADVR